MHRFRFAGGIALIAASAVGCGMATASRTPDLTVRAEPTMIKFVDPAQVDGLITRTVTRRDAGDRYVHIAFPDVRTAPALTKKLEQEARRRLDDFVTSTKPDSPEPRPELNMDWQLTAATHGVTGVRLRTGEFHGANWTNSRRTLWYDHTTDQAFGSTGLLDGESALQTLAGVVQRKLQERKLDVDISAVVADPDVFDSMAFNPRGELVVEFDDYQVGPGSLGRVAVAVPPLQTEALLSEAGRRARTAVLAARPVPSKTLPVKPPRTPAARSSAAGDVDCAKAKCIALTFDDGPGPATGELLDVLAESKARATFFTVGSSAAAAPELLRRMSEEGHLVGNHSWAHHDLSKLSNSKIADSLGRTQQTISAATGQTPTLARPPYGAWSKDLALTSQDMGMALVNWDIDTLDRNGGDPKAVAELAIKGARPGAIVLMHDSSRTSVAATPIILERLTAEGYTFVTVPELYGSAGMTPGRLYSSGPKVIGKRPLT
ncbi:polysaccharide deacetylase family protein [Nonomuraea sp. NPDC046570]|uniref:polysaccharide deacetylase family protein n=1 Tax=Nonomuraea sp. NPDC046570 TaxID=3155255 RepID=UPI0033C798C0